MEKKTTRCRDCLGIIGGCTIFLDEGEDNQPNCGAYHPNGFTEEQKDDAVNAMNGINMLCSTPKRMEDLLGLVKAKLKKDCARAKKKKAKKE